MIPGKTSIIITTYNHLEDNLKPCIESIKKYTDLNTVEVIVVANGCKDGTEDYVRSLGEPFKVLSFEEPLGYPKANNEGMMVSDGEYIVLLNDDTVILDSIWIHLLRDPFFRDPYIGISGPVKFTWDCGGVEKRAIAFWCCMFKRSLVEKIGYLDEIFYPGMGEDGDYSIRAELAGYKLVQVPVDTETKFGEPLGIDFPIWHKGNGTFTDSFIKNDAIKNNNIILIERYGNKGLDGVFDYCCRQHSDINELFPVIKEYASKCGHITEMGVRGVYSTYAFLAGRPKKMISYDIRTPKSIQEAIKLSQQNSIDFKFIEQDVLTATIEETDLLFIDTLHSYMQLSEELKLHGNKAKKYLMFHDTHTFGEVDELETGCSKKGLKLAITEFIKDNPHWVMEYETPQSNGLIILKRKAGVKYSIIVPTCSTDGVTLQTCLEKIFSYTDMTDKEIIVAANGCDGRTLEFLDSFGDAITVISWPDKQGQIVPINTAAKIAQGEYLVFIDDDTHLTHQDKDCWIKMLYEPFSDSNLGMSGVFQADYPYLGKALHNGCTMYKKEAWDKVDGMDAVYGFGYLCDTDISLRIRKIGYNIAGVGEDNTFPLYHPGSDVHSERKKKDIALIRKNRDILYNRHSNKPKISIIVPTYNHLSDCLKPCLDSVAKLTNLEDVEIIVVANGCKDGTADYVDSLGHPFKLVWFDEGLGFTKATNAGIKRALGEYIILLNNDTVILDQAPKNAWIDMLVAPFLTDEKVGITGPLELWDSYADARVMIFFCVCIKRKLFDEIGLLDEAYSPGGGEDICFSVEAQKLGYKQVVVPGELRQGTTSEGEVTNSGGFPIYHKGEGTFSESEFPEYGKRIIKDNGMKNMIRYNKNIRLNLGSGGVEVPGYISVDKYDYRASIIMDVYDLELPNNSVQEILASHLFEHTNPYHAVDLLRKWFNVLKPGGKLVMELPNLEELCKEFLKGDKWTKYAVTNCIYGSVNTKDNKADEITAPHLFGWWPETITEHLTWAGFSNIVILPEQIPHPVSHCNMRVEATKPL